MVALVVYDIGHVLGRLRLIGAVLEFREDPARFLRRLQRFVISIRPIQRPTLAQEGLGA